MKTILLDGNNATWRLQRVLPTLTAGGHPVQVIYGLLRLVHSVLEMFEPDTAIVCWDLGRSAHRLKLYPEYKATRDHNSTPEKKQEYKAVMQQIAILKDVLEILNIGNVCFPNTEADDIMGIASCCLPGEKIIVTSDQDALHLVNKHVSVWSPIRTKLYTQENFRKEIGLSPEGWLELRALTGDKSDNIEGVAKGFGPETAKELLLKYGSIDRLFSKSIAKRVEKLGNRYSLLYADGAQKKAFRNLMLMDLRVCIHGKNGAEITKLINKQVGARHKIDSLAVRKYFKEKKFASLLENFSTWLSVFQALDHE